MENSYNNFVLQPCSYKEYVYDTQCINDYIHSKVTFELYAVDCNYGQSLIIAQLTGRIIIVTEATFLSFQVPTPALRFRTFCTVTTLGEPESTLNIATVGIGGIIRCLKTVIIQWTQSVVGYGVVP